LLRIKKHLPWSAVTKRACANRRKVKGSSERWIVMHSAATESDPLSVVRAGEKLTAFVELEAATCKNSIDIVSPQLAE
jgi:hypothetical protein